MKSVYDIEMKSWDGQDGFLQKYKGKVSLLINVTGECGNAPEYGVIEKIYRTYKDQGFEVIAVPTNQFCGSGITYNDWVDGLSCGGDAREYAIEKYDVTYDFSELVNSKPGAPASQEFMEKEYPGREVPFPLPLKEGETPHEIFEEVTSQTAKINETLPDNNFHQGEFMFGNFEKYLIDKNGYVVKWYHNGTLMPYANKKDSFADLGFKIGTVKEEYDALCKDIEEQLSR